MTVSQKVQIDTYDYGANLPVPTVNALVDNAQVGLADSCNELAVDSGIYVAEFINNSSGELIPAGTYRLRTSSGGLPLKWFVTFAGVDGELVFARLEYAVEFNPTVTTQLATVSSGITTALARLGGWTGTGMNTVLGAMRALAAKATGLTPTDISTGTTYNNVTHSLEAIVDDVGGVSPLGPGEDQVTIEIVDDASGSGGLIVTLADILVELGISETATDSQRAIAQAALQRAQGAVIRHLHYNPLLALQTEFYPRMNANPVDGQGVWESEGETTYFRNLTDAATTELQLARLPVREQDNATNTISVWIDYDARSGTRSGSFATSTLKTEGSDFSPNYDTVDSRGYKVCRDGILRSQGRWPGLAGSVKVQYAAGYTAEELAGTDSVIDASPIREAVIDEAVRRVHKAYSRMKKRTGFGTGALSSESLGDYSYSADGALLAQLVGSNSDVLAETALKLESFVNFGAMLSS